MKFTIKLDDLQYILKCLRICIKTNTIELDGRLNIIADDDVVTFIATNSLTSISLNSTTASVSSKGDTSILYKDLQSFIGSFLPYTEDKGGVDDVVFKLNDKSVSVNLEHLDKNKSVSKHRIRLSFFPTLVDEDVFKVKESNFVLGSSMLKAALDKVTFVIDPLHNITFLRGVSMKFDEESLFFAGTNGIVISEYMVKNTSSVLPSGHILSYEFVKGLRQLIASLPNEEVSIGFYIESGQIKATIDTLTFVGFLIVGYEFPDYRSELLKDKAYTLALDKDAILGNLKPVLNLLDSDDNYRITFNYKGDSVHLVSDNSESSFDIDGTDEADVKIDLNGRLLNQTLLSIQDDKVIIKFTDEDTPMLFDSEMFEDQKTLITYIKRRTE